MPRRKPKDTRYTNTDFDLKSHLPFEFLRDELAASCTLLHYTLGDDGNWHAIVESSYPDDDHGDNRTASMDIRLILNALARLSDQGHWGRGSLPTAADEIVVGDRAIWNFLT